MKKLIYVFLERLLTTSLKLFKALSKLSIISCAKISGSGKLSKSIKLSSFNHVIANSSDIDHLISI